MLSSKIKVVLVIFGVLVLLFGLQAILGYVNTQKKRENFQEKADEDEREDVEEAPKTKTKKMSKSNEKKNKATDEEGTSVSPKTALPDVRSLRLSILECIEDIFDKKYPGSDQKPVLFDMLLKKESFEEIQEKQLKGENVFDIVKSYVEQHMNAINKDEKQHLGDEDKVESLPSGIDEFYKESIEAKRKATEKFVISSTSSSPNTNADLDVIKIQLSEIIAKVGKLQSDVESISINRTAGVVTSTIPSSIQNVTSTASSLLPTSTTNKNNSVLIEGFENRTSYAMF